MEILDALNSQERVATEKEFDVINDNSDLSDNLVALILENKFVKHSQKGNN